MELNHAAMVLVRFRQEHRLQLRHQLGKILVPFGVGNLGITEQHDSNTFLGKIVDGGRSRWLQTVEPHHLSPLQLRDAPTQTKRALRSIRSSLAGPGLLEGFWKQHAAGSNRNYKAKIVFRGCGETAPWVLDRKSTRLN